MRDKLRKRIALSAVTALTLFVAVPVYADTYDAVYDDAALLSDEEQQSLSEEITNLQETTLTWITERLRYRLREKPFTI